VPLLEVSGVGVSTRVSVRAAAASSAISVIAIGSGEPSEGRSRPADRGHEAQGSEGERPAESHAEQAPGPRSVLREREDQARHDDGDSDEHVGDRAAQTAHDHDEGPVPAASPAPWVLPLLEIGHPQATLAPKSSEEVLDVDDHACSISIGTGPTDSKT